jgi:4-amino-4-deoxy-L-arabinose transferase-like glycosyltransferase
VVFGLGLGLGVDESYTVATSRQLQLSTFDHPPLAWWLAWGSAKLFATESALALRLPFILLFALTTWLMYRLTALLFGERAGFWAAATLNLAPVIAWTSGTWIVPDGPLNAALVAGAYAASVAMLGARSQAPLWWLAAGACGGLALLSKFHGAFLFAGVGLVLLTSPKHRGWLLTPWPYAGVLVAGVMFLPVIVWNAQHAWVSFAFQGGRAGMQAFAPLGPFLALAGNALYLLPWLWLPLIACLVRALVAGPASDRGWMMACLAVGPILVFTAVGLNGTRVLPHWAAPGYLMLFPLLGAEVAAGIDKGSRRVRYWLIGCAASLIVLLAAVVAMSVLPWPTIAWPGARAIPYPLQESLDWSGLERELEARGLADEPHLFVAATRWHEAGKIDYAIGGRWPVLCLCRDPRGYGVLTEPERHLGETALIIGRNLTVDRIAATYGSYFRSIEPMPPIAIVHAGKRVFELSVYVAREFRASAEQPNLIDPLSLRGN